jgi:hypothetical protein
VDLDESSTPGPDDHLRASDADRQQVADRLRKALDEGRLTLLEYDERLGAAYGAQTYGELAKVTRDLPATAPEMLPAAGPVDTAAARAGRPAAPVPAHAPGRTRSYLIQQGRGWLGGAVIMNGIWAATSGFDWSSYWPGVVLPIWAVAIVGGLISGHHRKDQAEPAQGATDPQRGELDPHRGQPHWRFDHLDRQADRHRERSDRRYPDQP